MLNEDLTSSIDYWIEALHQYTFTQLCTKPLAHSWSLGEMYLHLIDDASFYVEQIKICFASSDHADDEANTFAKSMFKNNSFPDEILPGAPDNDFIPQPNSKEQLENGLQQLKIEFNLLSTLISQSSFRGKSKHPSFDYFSARKWMQFAEMHFRHHRNQKKRIDAFLIDKGH